MICVDIKNIFVNESFCKYNLKLLKIEFCFVGFCKIDWVVSYKWF